MRNHRAIRTVGSILLAVGLGMTMVTGFTIVRSEKVLNLGEIEIYDKDRTPVYWGPVTGIILAGAGLALLVVSMKSRGRTAHEA